MHTHTPQDLNQFHDMSGLDNPNSNNMVYLILVIHRIYPVSQLSFNGPR